MSPYNKWFTGGKPPSSSTLCVPPLRERAPGSLEVALLKFLTGSWSLTSKLQSENCFGVFSFLFVQQTVQHNLRVWMHVVEFVYFRPFKFQEGGLGGIKISLPDGLTRPPKTPSGREMRRYLT